MTIKIYFRSTLALHGRYFITIITIIIFIIIIIIYFYFIYFNVDCLKPRKSWTEGPGHMTCYSIYFLIYYRESRQTSELFYNF